MGLQRQELLVQRQHAALFGDQGGESVGRVLLDRDHRPCLARRALGGEEDVEPGFEIGLVAVEPSRDRRRLFLVELAAELRHRRRRRAKGGDVEARAERRDRNLARIAFGQSELRPRGRDRGLDSRFFERAQLGGLGENKIERVGDAGLGRRLGDDGEGFGESRVERQGAARVGHQRTGGDVVGDRKMRRHARFERKPLEQRLAERVDRLHAQAAGRFEDRGEQHARAAHFARVGRAADPLDQRRAQRRIVARRPFGQKLGQTFAHFGGGGFGEGKAQDRRRPHPAQQQVHDPRRQDMGLARARVGRDPNAGRRVRRQALIGVAARDGIGLGHSSPPPSDHSATRAR